MLSPALAAPPEFQDQVMIVVLPNGQMQLQATRVRFTSPEGIVLANPVVEALPEEHAAQVMFMFLSSRYSVLCAEKRLSPQLVAN